MWKRLQQRAIQLDCPTRRVFKRDFTEGVVDKDGKHIVTMIPGLNHFLTFLGDGIGPEISKSVKRIFAANNVIVAI